jgi:two-component system heavy metal sensor histidine kinase CusS
MSSKKGPDRDARTTTASFAASAPRVASRTRPRAWSLATRLTFWYTASTFTLVLGATGVLYFALAANLRRSDKEELREEVEILRALLHESSTVDTRLQWEVQGEYRAIHPTRLHKRVMDSRGRTVLETPGMKDEIPQEVFPTPPPESADPSMTMVTYESQDHLWLIASGRARLGSGPEERQLQFGMDLSRESALLARYRRRLWAVLVLALAPSVLIGRLIARRGIRPVERITETARRIRSTTLNERIGTERLPSELEALAATFNEMLDRLEESFQRLSRFSADIAHELRTPIQNMRGGAEVALGRPRPADEYREALVSSLEECEGLSRLIDSLLFLARAESPEAQLDREPIDVALELESVRSFYDAAAAVAGVSLSADCVTPLPARLDRTLFQRAVANLVGNALAATPRGGAVRMIAREDETGVRIEVADTGSGIPPDLLPRVFDRFYRVDGSRTKSSGGSGLGLAIVKCIAEMHGGSITIASTPGSGTRVTLHLASPSPAAVASHSAP